MRVAIEWREQGDASEDGTTSAEPKEEQRLIGVKVHHANLIMKKLYARERERGEGCTCIQKRERE